MAVSRLVMALLIAVNTELMTVLTLEMKDSSGLAAASGVANADNVFDAAAVVSMVTSPGPGCAARWGLVTIGRMRRLLPNSRRAPANSTRSAGALAGSPTGEPAADNNVCTRSTAWMFDSATVTAGADESPPADPPESCRDGGACVVSSR
jgi:hypothetical protein